jgi:hypothetical protein
LPASQEETMSLDDRKAGRDEAAAPDSRRNAREYYHDKKDRVFVRPIQGHTTTSPTN